MARSTTNRFKKTSQSSVSNLVQPVPQTDQSELSPIPEVSAPIRSPLSSKRETKKSHFNKSPKLPEITSSQHSSSLLGVSRTSHIELPVVQETGSSQPAHDKPKTSSRRRKLVIPDEKVDIRKTSQDSIPDTESSSSNPKSLSRRLHRGSRFYTMIPDTSQDRLGEVVFPKIPQLSHSQPEYPKSRVKWGIYPRSVFQKLFILSFLMIFCWYRFQIYRLGYCDKHLEPSSKKSSGNYSNLTYFKATEGSYLDYILPHCLNCPLHGECKNRQFLGCEEGFSSLAHPLNTPLLPFPPTCINDLEPIKKVDGFTKLSIDILGCKLGYHQCYDSSTPPGLTRQELHRKLIRFKDASLSDEAFEELFQRIMDQLEINYDLVAVSKLSESNSGEDMFVSKYPSFNTWCRMKIYTLSKLKQYQNELLLIGFSLLLVLYFWKKYQQYQQDSIIAKKCITLVLRMLMEKDHMHLLYPNLHQESSISIVHARDQLLARKYPSLKTRERIWKHVIAQIETNANVRTYQQEFRGDAHRVWEWVGETQPFLRKPTKLSRELNSLEFGSNSPLNSQDEEGEVSD